MKGVAEGGAFPYTALRRTRPVEALATGDGRDGMLSSKLCTAGWGKKIIHQ